MLQKNCEHAQVHACAQGVQLRPVNPANISVALAGNKCGLKLWLCGAWTMHLRVCMCVCVYLFWVLLGPSHS